jgi:uncharacterized SAM-binding protein YcdF (DUF218 family)
MMNIAGAPRREYHERMFFTLSKVLWFVLSPVNLLLIALCIAVLLSFTRKGQKWAIRILRVSVVIVLIFAVVPVAKPMISVLENRFPENPALPEQVHGIVILGGVINPMLSAKRQSPQLNDAVERLTVGADLARRYPKARVIFSGGSGDLFNPEHREAHYAPKVFAQLGLTPDRVTYEDKARNTAENATYARQLANPSAGENWILITSAFHMPRAVGVFRKAGWTMIPYPVDFGTAGDEEFNLSFRGISGGIGGFGNVLHEYIGLIAYWVTGRTATWFPSPENEGVRD